MLFTLPNFEHTPPTPDAPNVRKREKRPVKLLNFKSYGHFAKDFPGIDPGFDYHIINQGTWSMHEFLIFLLREFTGPANLYITTWSINESVIQTMVGAKQEGMIKDIHFLFDFRVKKYRPAAFHLADKNFNVLLTSCHAKVTVIRGEYMDITILGSANYTRNNRIEAMILMPGKNDATQHQKWITDKFNSAKS